MNNNVMGELVVSIGVHLECTYCFSHDSGVGTINNTKSIAESLAVEKSARLDDFLIDATAEYDSNYQPAPVGDSTLEEAGKAIKFVSEPDRGSAEYFAARVLVIRNLPNKTVQIMRQRSVKTILKKIYSMRISVVNSYGHSLGSRY